MGEVDYVSRRPSRTAGSLRGNYPFAVWCTTATILAIATSGPEVRRVNASTRAQIMQDMKVTATGAGRAESCIAELKGPISPERARIT